MNLRYKPKHMKQNKSIPWHTIHSILNFIIEEISWYIQWWFSLFEKVFHKLYQFGEWIIEKSNWLIDAHDDFWDKIEEKFYGVGN